MLLGGDSMNNLQYLRKKHDLTLREIERFTNINFSNLAQIEKGKRNLTQKHIETLCSFFKVSSDFLLGKSDFGISLSLSSGFITINKADYESYLSNNLIEQYIFNKEVIRKAKKELEDSIDPLFNQDTKEEINKELNKLSKKQLEKVLTFIKEFL